MDYRWGSDYAVILDHGVASSAFRFSMRSKHCVFVKSMGDALVMQLEGSLMLIADFMCITRMLSRRASEVTEGPANLEAGCICFCCATQIVGCRLLLLRVLIITWWGNVRAVGAVPGSLDVLSGAL